MRLKQRIDEGGGKSLHLDTTIDTIIQDCSDAWNGYKNGHVLFRGNNAHGEVVHYKGRTDRKSANTGNYYTLAIDNDSKWKAYPKRSESFICTTDEYYARNYGGNVYNVFPVNGTKYGICPDIDMWWSFKRTLKEVSLHRLNGMIVTRSGKFGIAGGVYNNVKTLSDFKKLSKIFDERVKEYLHGEQLEDFKSDFIWKHYDGDLIKMFQKLLDPKKNGFKIGKSMMDIPIADGSKGNEVWFSGECYMIRADELRSWEHYQQHPKPSEEEQARLIKILLGQKP